MNGFQKQLLKATPLQTEHIQIGGRTYEARYVSATNMGQYFGYAFQGIVFIRSDL
jgi:hypothetical protein